MDNPNYYAIIPAEVRYDIKLKANEKLLYGEISALSNKDGYCSASNAYFSKLYGKHKDTISDWISNLTSREYVKSELIRDEYGRVAERRLYLSVKIPIPYRQKDREGIGENTEYNNTSNNIKEKEEEDLEKIVEFYNNNVAMIVIYVYSEIESFLEEGMEADLIIEAMKESVSRNKRNWKYIKAILNDCSNNKIYTKQQYLSKQKEYKNRNDKTAKEIKQKEEVEYEEIEYTKEEYQKKLLGDK